MERRRGRFSSTCKTSPGWRDMKPCPWPCTKATLVKNPKQGGIAERKRSCFSPGSPGFNSRHPKIYSDFAETHQKAFSEKSFKMLIEPSGTACKKLALQKILWDDPLVRLGQPFVAFAYNGRKKPVFYLGKQNGGEREKSLWALN